MIFKASFSISPPEASIMMALEREETPHGNARQIFESQSIKEVIAKQESQIVESQAV
jgi:hypothetical protein